MTGYLVTPLQMKKAEQLCEANGVSTSKLMETAGEKIAEGINSLTALEGKKIYILCGGGNNGGDGYAVAKSLLTYSAAADVIAFESPKTDIAADCLERCKPYFASYTLCKDENADAIADALSSADIIVDCIFGTGFHGEIENENIVRLITAANNSQALRFSADVPSGCNAENGEGSAHSFKADYTFALGALKCGHIHIPCSELSGELVLLDIGIPDFCYEEYAAVITDDSVYKKLPKRNRISNKGDYGRLLNIAGSENFIGAAWLSTNAALRIGTGLVTLCSVQTVTSAVSASLYESTYLHLEDSGHITTNHINDVLSAAEHATAVLIGCGTGCNEDIAKITLSLIKYAGCPVVVDADGINSLVPHINEIKDNNGMVVLTPHLKEFSRLSGCDMGYILKNKLDAAKIFAREYNVHLLLKDAYSVYAAPDGFTQINMSGNAALAKAGSGDTLAGTIAGLMAGGMEVNDAVIAGAYLFGKAAEYEAKTRDMCGIMPSELPNSYAYILKNHR